MKSIQEIGVEAVVYGLPLVVMDTTMRVSTNVPGPQPNAHAPANQFGNMSKYPSASDHTVVRMNIDTLYSWAWLDLSREPIVLSVPDTNGRYYMMPMLDAWTNVFASPGTRTTGDKAGNFAVTDYGFRAVVTFIGLGANLPADAIYPFAFVDSDGKPFSGANRYVVHFDKGQTPPANAFWSLTMYDAQGFPVENPINRYTISSWMPLTYNPDGSLDVYVQKDSPGKDKESNWLPASADEFGITIRVYHPKPPMLEGTWLPPPVTRVN